MSPRVSICTSVLNQIDLLRRNIESIRAQTLGDWEHIIVDDGSTEDIKSLVESFADPRLVYVRHPENRGFQAGYNLALSMATGDYVELLAADEFVWERKLEVQVAWMDEHPDIGCTWGLPTPNVGQPWTLGSAPQWQQYQQQAHNRSREAWIRTLLTLNNIPIGGASMLMRRECYADIGGFDPQFFAVSDLEMFARFFKKYQGWILPYRLADAVHPLERLSGRSTQDSFQAEMKLLHAKHSLVLPSQGQVTIGIPVRNMEKFVAASIQSVLDQTYQDFHLVIVDDASTDATVAEIQKFNDPRIDFQQFDENRGVSAAHNHMLGSAGTTFYVPFAADDVLDPTFLERCLAEFARDPWLEFVASQTDFLDVEGKPVTAGHPFLQIQKATNKSREQWLAQLWYGNNYFGVGMYRTAALRDIGGWDSSVGVIADYDVYLKLLARENIHVIEEPLTHTRIHDAQRSLLKGREDHFKLRQNYHSVKSRYYPPRMKVIIATPFYEMRGFSPYIVSMTQTIKALCAMGIEHEFWELSGDSYVDRAKNTLFNKFLEDPAATDLFMIDSDMQWNAQSFINMLSFPEDIVQGSYPQKNAWATWTARPLLVEHEGRMEPVGRMLGDGSALIKAEYLAGGFIRVKRACLEKYRDAYPDYVYHDAGADPSYPERLYTEFFTCERAKNEQGISLRWGEDRVFGRRMMAIGVESWIYPNIDFGHYGINGWMGNYDKHLKTPIPEEKAA